MLKYKILLKSIKRVDLSNVIDMGYLTIQIKNSWLMQNNQRDGIPNSTTIDNRVLTDKIQMPLASLVRLTNPASMLQFVEYCNTNVGNKEIDLVLIDILSRIKNLLNGSKISKACNGVYGATRKSASEARISLVLLMRCNSICKAYASSLLLHSLEFNGLSTSDHERLNLQMLWVELVEYVNLQMLEKGGEQESRIMTSILLVSERLNFINDIRGKGAYSNVLALSYSRLSTSIGSIVTEEFHLKYLIDLVLAQLNEFQIRRDTKGTCDFALKILTGAVTQNRAKSSVEEIITQMAILYDERRYIAGVSFLKILATSATMDLAIAKLYIQLCIELETFPDFSWQYTSIIQLGVIACDSLNISIRNLVVLALNTLVARDSLAAKVGSVFALRHIYQTLHHTKDGDLARKFLNYQRQQDQPTAAFAILNSRTAKIIDPSYSTTISNLFLTISNDTLEYM